MSKKSRKNKNKRVITFTRARRSNRVVAGVGPRCLRCDEPTQVREHGEVTEKMLRQPFYYLRWYCCMNRDCRTTLIMPEEFKVYPPGKGPLPRLNEGDDIVMDVLAEL